MTILIAALLLALGVTLLYHGRAYWAWLVSGGLALAWWWMAGVGSPVLFRVVAGVFGGLALLFGVPALRE